MARTRSVPFPRHRSPETNPVYRLCRDRNFTYARIAKLAGVAESTVHRCFTGEIPYPVRIFDALPGLIGDEATNELVASWFAWAKSDHEAWPYIQFAVLRHQHLNGGHHG